MKTLEFIQDHPAMQKKTGDTGEYGELIAEALIRNGIAKEAETKPEKPKKGETPG